MAKQEDDYSVFLDKMLLGADGASRKASPLIISPLPPSVQSSQPSPLLSTQTPTGTSSGETIMKRFAKSRHNKASSQTFRLDSSQKAVLKNEFENQIAQQPRAPSEDQALSQLHNSITDSHTQNEVPEEKEKPTLTKSLTKRFPKMTLGRSISIEKPQSANNNSTSRPRSPSKDGGGLMRLGNRSAIGSKLGFGKKPVEDKEDSQHPSPTQPLPSSFVINPGAILNNSRRSSAPSNLVIPPVESLQLLSFTSPQTSSLSTATLNNEFPEEIASLRSRISEEEPSPMFLSEKNNSSSSQIIQNTSDNNTSTSSIVSNAKEDRKELDELKKDHSILEARMAKTPRGALLIAKSLEGRPAKLIPDIENIRIAALTLQESNDKRIRELEQRMRDYDIRCQQVGISANRVREQLIDECKKVYDKVTQLDSTITSELHSLKEREVTFKTNMTKNENELKLISEKVGEAVLSKEKNFNMLMSDAEGKLKTLSLIRGTNSGWLDAIFHSISEFVILGGGTLLSIFSYIFVFLKGFLPCFGSKKKSYRNPRNLNTRGTRNSLSQ